MSILKDSVIIPLNRQLFIPKEGDLKMEDLIIETEGDYKLFEKNDYIIVKNNDCCRGIEVTIKTRE
ncbi:MAG: hypothetical protein PHT79_07230 [Syntrophomonadaceae bacterium]|nr:hypothetical protein [Syntrophomonadaceae bacterium]MDD4549533.1 hypothetical protein [Syntrophomonadaceae bacterium]